MDKRPITLIFPAGKGASIPGTSGRQGVKKRYLRLWSLLLA